MEEVQESIERANLELKRLKAMGEQSRVHHLLERDGMHDMLRQMKHKLKKEINPKLLRESPLKQYSQCMKRVSYQSAYVLTFEARMCRSLHIMAILEEQLAITKEECKSRIDTLEGAGAIEKEEELKIEMEILNKLVIAENSKREMEQTYTDIIRRQDDALSTVEREAWGRSLTEFSLEDSSFVLPSIQEEKEKEGRLASMLNHSLAQSPCLFQVEDVSLGTAEMASQAMTNDIILQDDSDEDSDADSEESDDDDEAYEERKQDRPDAAAPRGLGRYDRIETQNDNRSETKSSHSLISDFNSITEYDVTDSEGEAEFVSPDDADSKAKMPWRKTSREIFDMMYEDDDEDEDEDYPSIQEDDDPNRMVVHGLNDDETEYTEYTEYSRPDSDLEDDGSEFQSPEEAHADVSNPWRRSSNDDHGSLVSPDTSDRQYQLPVTYDDEESEMVPQDEDSYVEDDGSEFQSPEEANINVTNPWRRSSSQEKYTPRAVSPDVADRDDDAFETSESDNSTDEEVDYDDEDSDSDDGSEFQSPESAHADTTNPWRRSSSVERKRGTIEEEEFDDSFQEDYEDEDSDSEDDGSEFQSPESAHADATNPWRRSSSIERNRGTIEEEKFDDSFQEDYEDEDSDSEDDGSEFQSPESAHADTTNPWRRSSSVERNRRTIEEDKVQDSVLEDEDSEFQNANISNTDAWKRSSSPEINERNRCDDGMKTSDRSGGVQGEDDEGSIEPFEERSIEPFGYPRPQESDSEDDVLNQESLREECTYGFTKSMVEEDSESEDSESESSETGDSESDYSDDETEAGDESWVEGSTVGEDETEAESVPPVHGGAATPIYPLNPPPSDDDSSSSGSEDSETSESEESGSSETNVSETDDEYSESIQSSNVEDPGKNAVNGDDQSPRSVTEDLRSLRSLTRESTQRFSNTTSSSMKRSITPMSPTPEVPPSDNPRRGRSTQAVPAGGQINARGAFGADWNASNNNQNQNERKPNSQDGHKRDIGSSLLQSIRLNSHPKLRTESLGSGKVSPSPKYTQERTSADSDAGQSLEREQESNILDEILQPQRSGRSLTPSRNGRPSIGKSLSSNALLLQIEKQSWYSSELTKHALEDPEGWEIDRGQGRIQPLAQHRINALLEEGSLCGSRY